MTTYAEAAAQRRRDAARANPFLDLTKQILYAPDLASEDIDDALRVREVILSADASATAPWWGRNPEFYDTVKLAKNFVVPGICTVTGTAFEQRLQRDRPPGRHGTSVKQLGIQASKFEIELQLWTEEHLEQFEKLVPMLKAQRYTVEEVKETVGFTGNAGGAGFTGSTVTTKKKYLPAGPKPFDIYHPLLAMFRIRSAHVLRVTFPKMNRDGAWEVQIHCEEHIAKGAGTGSAVKTADSALEIVERNPLIGKTGATLARDSKKPSNYTKATGSFGGGGIGGNGASGGW